VKAFRSERRGNLQLTVDREVEIAAVVFDSLAMTSRTAFSTSAQGGAYDHSPLGKAEENQLGILLQCDRISVLLRFAVMDSGLMPE